METGVYDRRMSLRQIRIAKGLSQEELADLANTTQATISRVENGDGSVTLNLMRQIADALGVRAADLILDDRSALEEELLVTFRSLHPERRAGWIELARALREDQH